MSDNSGACFHCGLPIEPAALQHSVIQGENRSFCCSGCMLVCQAIHESGLDGFYDKLKNNDALAPPPDSEKNLEQYDLDDVQADFVTTQGNLSETTLLVEGIHCAACVWLIEHGLADLKGVLTANVNMAHHRLQLRWDRDQVLLSAVLKRLAQIGYKAVPYNQEVAEGAAAKRHKALLYRMAFAGFGVMNIMWISIALFAGATSASVIDPEHKHFFHWISLLIATPVLAYSGWPIIRSGIRSLMHGQLGMDLPVTIGALATYTYSVWITLSGSGEVYFDTVVTFLFIILVGRYLEGISRRNASSFNNRLMELQPRSALRMVDGEKQVIPPSQKDNCNTCNLQSSPYMNMKYKVIEIFRYAFYDLVQDVGKWLIIGIVAGGFISFFIPKQIVESFLSRPILAYPLMLIIAVPLYVCATGSIPIAASLIIKGMTPGAGLVFLIAGPATNTATLSFVGGKMGRKTLIIYLITIIVISVLFGLVVDFFFSASHFDVMSIHHGKKLRNKT